MAWGVGSRLLRDGQVAEGAEDEFCGTETGPVDGQCGDGGGGEGTAGAREWSCRVVEDVVFLV